KKALCFTSLEISLVMMKANQKPKSHAPPRSFFSCGFFRRCTQSVLSPTSPHQQPRLKQTTTTSSSSSSSASTSQSFTQWRFPPSTVTPPPPPLPVTATFQETSQIEELQLTSASESDKLLSLQLLERVIVPDPPSHPTCPPGLMRGGGSLPRDDGAGDGGGDGRERERIRHKHTRPRLQKKSFRRIYCGGAGGGSGEGGGSGAGRRVYGERKKKRGPPIKDP
ncbi:unnamed protein product, partial [Brassica rapa]